MINLSKVAEEFKIFCETVTIRGVSRIVKAKQIFISIFWLLAVLVCSCLLIWQLYLLIVKYFSYPFTTTIGEENISPTFPTITVCNLNPIVMAKEEYTNVLSWSKHLKNVQMVLKKTNYNYLTQKYSNCSEDYMKNLIRDLESPGGYFANFPIYDQSPVDTTKDLVLDHSLMGWDWTRVESTVEIQQKWDPNYYNCFEINVNDEEREMVRSLSMVLYVNNFPDVVMPGIYQLGGTSSKASGVRIKIHFPRTRGDMKNGISLGPGTETTFYIDMVNRTRLPYPYNKENCTVASYDTTETGYLYSRTDCMEYCIQQEIVDTCGCISINHLFLKSQLDQANYMLCGNMSNVGNDNLGNFNGANKSTTFYETKKNFLPKFVELLACQSSVLETDSYSCMDECLVSCKEVNYEYQGLYASWPEVTHHLAVYRRYVKNATSRMINPNLFDDYETLDRMIMNGSMSDASVIDKLNQLPLIKRNFLQINVAFQSNNPYFMEDIEMITPQSMLSSIGGTLSLWLGITIMTLAELIEFIFNVCIVAFKKKHEVKPTVVVNSVPKKF